MTAKGDARVAEAEGGGSLRSRPALRRAGVNLQGIL